MASIEELVKMKADYEAAIKENGEGLLKDMFKVFFSLHPEVAGLRWTQYTPYFNDGDPCVFRTHIEYAKVKPVTPLEKTEEDDEEDEDGYAETRYDSDLNKVIKATFGPIPEDIWLAVFGDHSEITATREGFEVEEYEHD